MSCEASVGERGRGEATAIEANPNAVEPASVCPRGSDPFSSLGEAERSFEGRTIGSKRVEDGRFEVRMRFVNLRRADRELLLGELR